ncbi:MAG: hypothetical protein VB050_08660 [Geobacteraceae bacterium]|nr:hypothetical protein [Geobacteraceae bacterium]
MAAPCLLLAAGALYLLLRLALSQPFATEKISGIISEKTGCRVTVSDANISGDTLTLEGISLWNPEGFSRGRFVSIRSISLSPGWIGLLAGKTSLASLELDGIQIRPEKSRNGQWNWVQVAKRFMRKKIKPAKEVSIARLCISDLSLIVGNRRLPPLGLDIRDFSTRGSAESAMVLSAADPSGNPIRLTAQGKLGRNPSFRIVLDAPRLSLASMQLPKDRNLPVLFGNASAGFRLAAELCNSLTTARITGSAVGIGIRAGVGIISLKGSLDSSIRYDSTRDEAWIDKGSISFNNAPPIRFSGKVAKARSDALFELAMSTTSIPLQTFSSLLPEKLRKNTAITGTLSTSGITISGSRKSGIISGRLGLSIRNGSIAENGRILLEKGSADMNIKGGSDGWLLNGRLFSAPGSTRPVIQSIEAPFSAAFSPLMKPLRLTFPAVSGRVAGASLKGRLSYLHGISTPWNINLSAGFANLSSLNTYLAKTSLKFDAGSGSLAAKATGSSLQSYEAHVTASADSLSFTSSGHRIYLGKAVASSSMRGKGHDFSAEGRLKLEAGKADGAKWDMNAGYAVGNGRLELRDAELRGDQTIFRLSGLTMLLPAMHKDKKDAGIPITGTIKGLEILRDPVSVTGISGSVNCRYFATASDRQLRGGADMTQASLAVKGRKAAALSARIVFSGKDATVHLRGASLGGPVEGTVLAKPFSSDRGLSFLVKFREQRLAELAEFAQSRQDVRLAGGLLNADLDGTMAGKSGLKAKLAATGRDISLRNAGGREIISKAELKLRSTLSGGDIILQEAVISRGREIAARLSGSVKQFASTGRKGEISCALDTLPLNSALDAFANVLPRGLQEAECRGTLAMRGNASLNGKRLETSGELTIAGASIEIPSQKVSIVDIDGRVPFSFIIPGQGQDRQAPAVSYSRKNYQRLLAAFRKVKPTGAPLRIGSVRFGALQTGKIEAYVDADRGMMEISSLNVTLYGGALMGKGFLNYDNGIECEADFLLDNLSLKQFCASFPRIEGYMTGRVDGVMSLYQGNNNVRGLNGFVNLWTRAGNGEKMLVSKEFLQKLAGKKLKGFFFTNDRSYDNGEISAFLRDGFLTFEELDISHRNLLGMKDLSVTVVPVQNRISLGHLLESIREAAARGKSGGGEDTKTPVQTDLKWLE